MGLHLGPKHRLICALGLVLLTCGIASARPPVQLRTGASSAANGYLEIRPDEYGAWSAVFATGAIGPNGDSFRPNGSSLQVAAFTSGFFLFVPTAVQRELLTDNVDWQAVTNGAGGPPFSADGSLTRAILTNNVASDSNGDGINDTANSSFRVTGGATNLRYDLRQRVFGVSSSVSVMQQDYVVTNDGTAPITFKMVRAFDGDLLWDANFESDSVGTTSNGDPLGPYVFEQEPNQPGQSVTLSILNASSYYGGKHGITPGLGAPPYDFGTDTEVWDVFGTPTSWINHIAGVGYNTNGQSGASPAGSTAPRDAFMGLELNFTLDPGASSLFSVLHTYGQTTPFIPEPGMIGLVAMSGLLALRRRA